MVSEPPLKPKSSNQEAAATGNNGGSDGKLPITGRPWCIIAEAQQIGNLRVHLMT